MLIENTNIVGTQIYTPVSVPNQIEFTTPGTYSWTVPAGVTTVSIVAVGAGAAGGGLGYGTGGSGGSLSYLNNYSVTPGQIMTVTVANTTIAQDNLNSDPSPAPVPGSSSQVIYNSTTIIKALGGNQSGTNIGTAYYSGGAGSGGDAIYYRTGAGGGAGGYSGVGGAGGSGTINTKCAGQDGQGGGGGGGAVWIAGGYHGGGGGVGIYGQGSNGLGGNPVSQYSSTGFGGGGGSSGTDSIVTYYSGATGGLYGGGGSGGQGGMNNTYTGNNGGQGAVRIIWPGNVRQFPSTRTTNEDTYV